MAATRYNHITNMISNANLATLKTDVNTFLNTLNALNTNPQNPNNQVVSTQMLNDSETFVWYIHYLQIVGS